MSVFHGLSIILPTINETASLKKTVEEIFHSCNSEDIHEIILATAVFATPACRAACEDIQKENKTSIPIYIYVQTGTFEDAIRDLTEQISGSHFIYQPTDLEEDPRLLAEVIRLAKLFPDSIISGSRMCATQGFNGFSPVRKVLYGVWRILFFMMYSNQVTDSTLLFRCMPSKPAKQIILTEKSYAVLFELFLKLLRLNTPVVEFPVIMGKRVEGKSSTRILLDGFRYLHALIVVRFTPVERFLRSSDTIPEEDNAL